MFITFCCSLFFCIAAWGIWKTFSKQASFLNTFLVVLFYSCLLFFFFFMLWIFTERHSASLASHKASETVALGTGERAEGKRTAVVVKNRKEMAPCEGRREGGVKHRVVPHHPLLWTGLSWLVFFIYIYIFLVTNQSIYTKNTVTFNDYLLHVL